MVQFKKEEKDDNKFRDNLATIDDKGKRLWVYAKKPKGEFTTYRNIFGIILLILFFAVPFIKINGQAMLLLNFIERKIVILGVQFWPQDFHLFFLAMVALMVFIILFTVTYGRLWCGWACPQTVFMEIVFRRIEYWIEGDAYHQKKLAQKPWNFIKIFRKVLKHFIFYLISFIIGNFFLAYIIGIEGLLEIITDDPTKHVSGLAAMLIFSGLFYFVFSWFREQVCTIVCPYGRLQGVLLDRNSIVVSYDYQRGDPKGTFRKGEDRAKEGKGHCINCTQCVQVCPTGIDIRNGTQLECINCACCIDACNSMMESVGQPKGLIRYTSERVIAEGSKLKFNARTIAYSIVLLILIGVIGYAMTARSTLEATVLRAPGMLYQDQGDGKFSNLYNIKMVNKTDEDLPITVDLISQKGEIKIIGDQIIVKNQSLGESVFFIILDEKDLKKGKMDILVGIYTGGRLIEEAKTTFVGPN